MHVVRLMKRCNSHCEFCFVEEEMAIARREPDIPLDEIKRQILSQLRGSIIDFFGGEPTLYPDIVETIRFAHEQGYRPMMASNGRRFARELFTQAIAETGIELVRSTLLGHTPELHNALSAGGRRSFQETIQGFRNLLQYKIPLQVNMVILRQNYEHLMEMTRLLLDIGVRDLKFGSLVGVKAYPHLAARIFEVRPFLAAAIAEAKAYNAWVAIEKTPICMLPEYADHYLPESDPLSYTHLDINSSECQRCLVRERCFGVDEEYAELFGYGELEAVESVELSQLTWPPQSRLTKPGF